MPTEPKLEVLTPPDRIKQEVSEALSAFGNLRYYQREAIECTAYRLVKTLEFLLIVLPTGSGKSWVIAGLARLVQSMMQTRSDEEKSANKKILVLAPSAELVTQNRSKMLEAGFPASIYMADLGKKDLSEDIVFAAPISFGNSVANIVEDAHVFGAVVIDEAHEFTPMIRKTIETLQQSNPKLRVIGLTATPYRMAQGYIYAQDVYHKQPPLTARHTKEPPFAELVYEKTAVDMIEEGFLAPPLVGDVQAHYDTGTLQRTASGAKFTEKSNLEVFVEGKAELTRKIVEDVISKSRRRRGVMFFAQNRRHARQIVECLPEGDAALIDTDTDKRHDRPRIIQEFKEQKIKYLVNVGTLIKGFDAPHVDVIAILAHTESVARLQQIFGRGLRPSPDTGKRDCLILDYGENLPEDGDIFNPKINLFKRGDKRGSGQRVEVVCPECENTNEFPPAKIPGLGDVVMNLHGYLVSGTDGQLVSSDNGQPIAGHLGTHCHHFYYPNPEDTDSRPVKCSQTWGTVTCDHCGSVNSHRAEYCLTCDGALKNAENRLSLVPSRPEGPFTPRLAKVRGNFRLIPGTSRSGNPTLRITAQVQELPYFTVKRFAVNDEPEAGLKAGDPLPEGESLPVEEFEEREVLVTPEPEQIQVWLNPTVNHPKAQKAWAAFLDYAQQFISETLTTPDSDVPAFLQRFVPNNPAGIPVAAPEYVLYCEQRTAQGVNRTFYEILELHQRHPYAPDAPDAETKATPDAKKTERDRTPHDAHRETA